MGEAPPVDVEAATDVLLAHRDDFVDFVARRVEDRAAAEDVVQDALVRALDRLSQIRAGDALLGWFYVLLRNAIVDHHRRRASATRAASRLADEPTDAATEETGRTCTCVSHVARALKPQYAEALRRVDVEGVPVKDFAAEVGITPGNAAVRVFRARESLRKKVHATCKTCAAAGCTDCTCDHMPVGSDR